MATKEIAIIKQVAPLVEQAQSLTIENQKDMTAASEFLSKLNKTLDGVTKEKEKVTKPMNEALKAERARWKPYESQLEEAISIVRKGMTTYQTEQTRIAAEKQAKIAGRVGAGKGKIGVETAVKQMQEIEKPEENIETSAGSTDFIPVPCFEVMDITMLPIEYHLADEVAIRKEMRAGRELAGVRYWIEQRPRNFR
jgi:hypothetical protein